MNQTLTARQVNQLRQIAESFDGVWAGDLIDKQSKAELADAGMVTPKYGARFYLTSLGERWARVAGFIVGPFAVSSGLIEGDHDDSP